MKYKWLHQKQNNSCILFFNGWGMDEHAVSHMNSDGFDVCIMYDYNPLEQIPNIFDSYAKLYIVAWSLGVYAAEIALHNSALQFEKKIAINGTGKPIDDTYGIPENIFTATLNTWNEKNRERFNIRMCGGHRQYSESTHHMSTRSIKNQHDELKHIYNTHTQTNAHPHLIWDTAIIGTHDLIFSKENQENYWSKQVNSLILPINHYPFNYLKKWRTIIDK
ncbi:MAG: DUF452 family protein [Bacteroidales bacterium]